MYGEEYYARETYPGFRLSPETMDATAEVKTENASAQPTSQYVCGHSSGYHNEYTVTARGTSSRVSSLFAVTSGVLPDVSAGQPIRQPRVLDPRLAEQPSWLSLLEPRRLLLLP